MYHIKANNDALLEIGRVGENQATQFSFDLTEWVETFGVGTPTLLNQRPTESAAYPCITTFEDNILTWVVKAADTQFIGYGKLQLSYTINSTIVKSAIFTTHINNSVSGTSEPPDPWQAWVDEVLEARDDAEEAAEEAHTYLNKSVRWDEVQSLSEEQKARARANIGATGGQGSVWSVNGKVGDVVLDVEDIEDSVSETDLATALTPYAQTTYVDGIKTELEGDIAEKYTKPNGGIPKTDLASGVQTSLGKADTALQEHQSLSAYRTSADQDVIDNGLSNAISGKQNTLTPGANITISGNTISATDTTYNEATTSVAGLMSASDKTKLNGVSSGAKNVSVASTGTATEEVHYITIDGVEKKLPSGSAGTTDYNDLENKPTLNGTTIQGAMVLDIPTKTSDLTNDSGYLTQHQSLSAYRTASAQDSIDSGIQGSINTHIANVSNPHSVTKAQVGLGNVNNTSDADKPISTATQTALNGITSDIDTIEGKIPAQASSSNQLADKDFVNSSIGTNTANYISNQGNPFTSLAQLEAYTGTVTNNDYAFVTGTDEQGNTYFDRYKATVSGSTITWAKEYRLNNSSFTASQWGAISSGITSVLVASYSGHLANTSNPHSVTKAQVGLGNVDNTSDTDKPISTAMQTALNGKQDVISDLETIRSGAALGATSIQEHQSLSAYRTSSAQDTIDATKSNNIFSSNPNILHNPFFSINQRGFTTESPSGSNHYPADRWTTEGAWATITRDSDGTLHLTHNSTSSQHSIQQWIENADRLKGKTVTISILLADGTVYSTSGTVPSGTWQTWKVFMSKSFKSYWGIYLASGDSDGRARIYLRCATADKTLDVRAMKLEIGSVSTISNDWIPDDSTELAKCQRCYQLYSTSSARPSNRYDCRPVMRATPTQGTITIDGTTYYYNLAEV